MSGKTLKTQKISTIEDLDKTAGYEKMPKMKKSELVETVGIYREACATTLKALRNKELDLSNFQVEVVRLNQSLKTQKKTSDEKYEKLERMYNDLFEEHQNAQEFMRLHGIHFVSSLSEKNLASNGSEQDGSSNGGSTSGEEQEDLEKTDKNDSPSSVVIPQNEGSENGEKDNSLSGKTDGGTEDDAAKAKNNAKDGTAKAEDHSNKFDILNQT